MNNNVGAEIVTALQAFRDDVGFLEKKGKNDAFKKNGEGTAYTVLDDIHRLLHKLSEYGLFVFHCGSEEGESVRTTVLHAASGQSISSCFPIPKTIGVGGRIREGKETTYHPYQEIPLTAQQLKMAITYGKRTNLLNILALPEEDDDGNSASRVYDDDSFRPSKTFNSEPDDDLF